MHTTVALVQCSGYHFAEITQALERLFSEIGGLDRFVQPGQTVLLKPNLLSAQPPDRAITTHPEVVRALIRLVKARGANPVVADSASSAINIENVWNQTGFSALCAEESVPLINLEKSGSRRFAVESMSFAVARPVLDADVIINVPKLKTHIFTVFTNAVKNMYGVIPGYQKTMFHKQYPDPRHFGEFLAVLYAQVRPALTVCDAIVGMEGNGPSAGTPVPLRFLAGAEDGVALDAAVCHLLGIDINKVPYFRSLRRMRAGETDWKNINLAGDALQDFEFRSLRLPTVWSAMIGMMIPDWLVRWVRPYVWIRPFVNEQCTFCGLCVKSCPVSALSIEVGNRPKLDAGKCIECCCCHEVCPASAVEMRQSPFLNLVRRGRLPS